MSDIGFNVNKFVKGSTESKDHALESEVSVVETTPKAVPAKRGTTKKKAEVATTPPVALTSMSYVQENIPYAQAYAETQKQLDDVISDLNTLGGELIQELQHVRGSKTLRNRFGYINDMTATASGIINAKLSAIKEKNSVIGTINKMELDRMKQLKTTASEEDDNARIANLYDAFISTPIGRGPGVLAPPMQDIMAGGASGPVGVGVVPIGGDQAAWEQNLDPAQARMVYEAKGTIETVVMYDSNSGNRWYEVVDKNTKQPVPGIEKPDSSYIYDLDLNVRGGFAKDANRNVIYPLIVVGGSDTSMNEY